MSSIVNYFQDRRPECSLVCVHYYPRSRHSENTKNYHDIDIRKDRKLLEILDKELLGGRLVLVIEKNDSRVELSYKKSGDRWYLYSIDTGIVSLVGMPSVGDWYKVTVGKDLTGFGSRE